MKLEFDFQAVKLIEFGVGCDDGDNQTFFHVTVDGDVQVVLQEMAEATWESMQSLTKVPPKYEPSEKHASCEHVYLPIKDPLAQRMHDLHLANNLTADNAALDKPEKVFCYYVRMTDKQKQRLTALRRASQFKGVLKKRLIRLATDALKIVEDKVFKLDNDFDLLIDAKHLHILRPSAFEFAGQLREAVLAAVPQNVEAIQKELDFVEFSGIQAYASKHPRAARYLASIRSQGETAHIDKQALKRLCKKTGVEVHESKGNIQVDESQVMGFLEVLDRRRYELELIKGAPEQFKAASRRKLDSQG